VRLDQYMATYWPEYSRSQWQKYIRDGYVLVNDQVSTETKLQLDEDDVVKHRVDKKPQIKSLDFDEIYRDDHVVVINKPTGVLTHAKGVISDEYSIAEYMRPLQSNPDTTNRPGIVHRLDRATSGVIICSRDTSTKRLLQKQFQDRKVHKTYIAVVDGVPNNDVALIDLPIARNPKKPSQHRVDTNGKPAQTSYRVLKTNGVESVVELKPKTGRTHQIRVHLEYIGCPIKGDVVYNPGTDAERLYLHASELEITIPKSQRKTFSCPIPDDMQTVIDGIHESS